MNRWMNEWVWSNGGMIVTKENWSGWRKTLYSVGGRWMNEYGAMVEWYWEGKTEVLGENLFPVPLFPPHISHGLKLKSPCITRIQSVPRSKHTPVSVIKTGQLMLYREIIAVCCQIHTKHVSFVRQVGVIYINTQGTTRSQHSYWQGTWKSMCQTKDTVQVLRQTGGNQSTRLTMRNARKAGGVISLFDNPNGNCRTEHQTTERQRPTRRNKPEWLTPYYWWPR